MKNILLFALLLLGLVAFQSCGEDEPFLGQSATFEYQFHNGQTVPTAAYAGNHPSNFSATMMIEEREDGTTNITINLMNTVAGETYRIHAHDAADSSTTPNGTPYNETPNSDILAQMAEGNGGTVSITQNAKISFDELLNTYEGFFVIHDPLQSISTTDISTYLVVGAFGRMQDMTNLRSLTFDYDFNSGQLVSDFAYEGNHSNSLSATIQVDELANEKSRITVRINNSMEGETYRTHAHDMADPSTTPNNTPYIETPNSGIFAMPILGNGMTAAGTKISDSSYESITTMYDGFIVIHDPLQEITTTDPTTYVVLGVFAR